MPPPLLSKHCPDGVEGASFVVSRILLFRLVRDGEVHCFPF